MRIGGILIETPWPAEAPTLRARYAHLINAEVKAKRRDHPAGRIPFRVVDVLPDGSFGVLNPPECPESGRIVLVLSPLGQVNRRMIVPAEEWMMA